MRRAIDPVDYWADRFIAAGARVLMTFERFMELSHARRERLLARAAEWRDIQNRQERQLQDAGWHGQMLITPIHHKPRLAWFRAGRRHK